MDCGLALCNVGFKKQMFNIGQEYVCIPTCLDFCQEYAYI